MNTSDTILKEFEKINTLLSPIAANNDILNYYFLVSNYKIITGQINRVNTIIQDNLKEDELSRMLLNEFLKANKNALDTLEKLATLSSDVMKKLLSLQIILTENIEKGTNNEYCIVKIKNNASNEEYLIAIDSIIDILKLKNNEEIEQFVEYSKNMISLNNHNKKVA